MSFLMFQTNEARSAKKVKESLDKGKDAKSKIKNQQRKKQSVISPQITENSAGKVESLRFKVCICILPHKLFFVG